MTQALTAAAPKAPAQFTEADWRTVKDTVAKGATDSEFKMFMHLSATYGLDPFRKEIWCIKRNPSDTATITTSRDGYLKIAKLDPNFDGLQSFVVKKGDHFNIDAPNNRVEHTFGTERGAILGAWAIAYHKKRRPVMCFVEFAEYKGNSPIWSKYPSAMIQKVAEVFVLKRQFDITGLVTAEEIDAEMPDEAPIIRVTPEPIEPPQAVEVDPDAPVSDELLGAIAHELRRLEWPAPRTVNWLKKHWEVDRLSKLNNAQGDEALKDLTGRKKGDKENAVEATADAFNGKVIEAEVVTDEDAAIAAALSKATPIEQGA